MLQPELIDVQPLDGYRLLLNYGTEGKKIFDVSPYIKGNWYGKLKDTNYFKTVHLSAHTVTWADGQDIAPHELYEYSNSQ